jgi:DeoR/GlpR family transcriptional regulator of sugar metabolism
MRSSLADISARREQLAIVLKREGYLSVGDLSNRFTVSEATIRRDLRALEQDKLITRTYGGALSEFDELFIPFSQRNVQNQEQKRKIAKAAIKFLKPRTTVFLDAGSTIYHIAEEIASMESKDLLFVTNNLPAAEKLAKESSSEIHLLGGHLLPHQLIVVGQGAGLSLSPWRFDTAFLSAEGMNTDGLWNSQDEISEFQRHVCGRSNHSVFCVDESKLNRTAPSYLMGWKQIDHLVTTASSSKLSAFQITVNNNVLLSV